MFLSIVSHVAIKFQSTQVLSKIYAILSDANKRAIYDEDGTVDEEDDTIFNHVSTKYNWSGS